MLVPTFYLIQVKAGLAFKAVIFHINTYICAYGQVAIRLVQTFYICDWICINCPELIRTRTEIQFIAYLLMIHSCAVQKLQVHGYR